MGLLLPLWLALVTLHDRAGLMLLLLAIPWISDTAAFACGHAWGRRKLAPVISPGKTWEGVCGAVAAVALYYGLLQWGGVELPPPLQGMTGLAVFLLLMILGVEGDLFESWIKRVAGVKDSGAWLPGHGGVLDRIDALMPVMPVAVLLMERAR
jgi:phosphatidate cytidylyltransferase